MGAHRLKASLCLHAILNTTLCLGHICILCTHTIYIYIYMYEPIPLGSILLAVYIYNIKPLAKSYIYICCVVHRDNTRKFGTHLQI